MRRQHIQQKKKMLQGGLLPNADWKLNRRMSNSFRTFSRKFERMCGACPSRLLALCSDIPVSWENDSVRSYRSCLARDGREGRGVGRVGLTLASAWEPATLFSYLFACPILSNFKYDRHDLKKSHKASVFEMADSVKDIKMTFIYIII